MRYWLPTIPLTPIDLINRHASATGSVRYAQLSSRGDYNGHHVSVSFKPHAVCGPVWNAEYYFGERVVLGRGGFEECVRAAKREFDRGARGTVVYASVDEQAPEPVDEQRAILARYGFEPTEDLDVNKPGKRPAWWTGAHEAVIDAIQWKQWPLMLQHALDFAGTPEEWPAERRRWLDADRERATRWMRDLPTPPSSASSAMEVEP